MESWSSRSAHMDISQNPEVTARTMPMPVGRGRQEQERKEPNPRLEQEQEKPRASTGGATPARMEKGDRDASWNATSRLSRLRFCCLGCCCAGQVTSHNTSRQPPLLSLHASQLQLLALLLVLSKARTTRPSPPHPHHGRHVM